MEALDQGSSEGTQLDETYEMFKLSGGTNGGPILSFIFSLENHNNDLFQVLRNEICLKVSPSAQEGYKTWQKTGKIITVLSWSLQK